MKLSEELAPYFRSGNDVPIERATIPADLGHRLLAELRRWEHVLEYDWSDLMQYGGDENEIREGLDFVMSMLCIECHLSGKASCPEHGEASAANGEQRQEKS